MRLLLLDWDSRYLLSKRVEGAGSSPFLKIVAVVPFVIVLSLRIF